MLLHMAYVCVYYTLMHSVSTAAHPNLSAINCGVSRLSYLHKHNLKKQQQQKQKTSENVYDKFI